MTEPTADKLEVLACKVDARPSDAPGIDALASATLGVDRVDGELIVSCAPSALEMVQRFVAAEQQCCATLSWNIERTPDAVRLRVAATAEQLGVLQQLFIA
jgi:hypothetical protein